MKRLFILAALSLSVAAVGCSDDPVTYAGGDTGNGSGNGNNDAGTEPPAGAAYEAEVEVTGGQAEGTSTGSAEASAEGQFHAVVFEGSIDLFLTTGDTGSAMVISAGVDTGGEVPGTFNVTPGLDGTWFNVTFADATGGGILEGQSGSISVDFCAKDEGDVVAGSFNNIATLDEITQADGGTFNGDFRATIVLSDGSITCPEPVDPPADVGTGEDTGTGGSCDVVEDCTGPVCPYEEFIVNCSIENCLDLCLNPMEFQACIECEEQCVEDSGIYDDAEALGLWEDLDECVTDAGCDEAEDEFECALEPCCDEIKAAYN